MSETSLRTGALWQVTATARPAGLRKLDGDLRADVVIVGAGFLGLTSAVHLSEAGAKVVVLEGRQVGWGASGRTGGQVIAGLKYNPEELQARHPGKAQALIELGAGAPGALFDLVRRHGIQCDLFDGGWLQPAHSRQALQALESKRRQWAKWGLDSAILDREETARMLGTQEYLGAWLDPRGGNIQPLSYCHGLAGAALGLGAAVFEETPVDRLSRNGTQWEALTRSGRKVTADQAIVCTNGYSDGLIPGLAESIIPANSFQVATHPLPESLGSAILPSGMSASDTKKLLLYFRRDAHGRFVIGGRGPFDAARPDAYKYVIDALERLYPQLKGQKLEFTWHGKVALTTDFLPHYHTPAPGLHIMLGFNGRGVALTSAMGRDIAAIALGKATASGHPLHAPAIDRIPFPFLKRLYIESAVMYYRLRDRFH